MLKSSFIFLAIFLSLMLEGRYANATTLILLREEGELLNSFMGQSFATDSNGQGGYIFAAGGKLTVWYGRDKGFGTWRIVRDQLCLSYEDFGDCYAAYSGEEFLALKSKRGHIELLRFLPTKSQ